MSKKKLLLYALTIIAGILWQTDILEGSFTFYTFLRIVGFIAIFIAYEVWIQVLLPLWEEWEKDDKKEKDDSGFDFDKLRMSSCGNSTSRASTVSGARVPSQHN